jgi:D-alanine-D-alanine ligase
MASKIRVGILCGGRSSEHEISCISAAGILSSIDRTLYEPVVIGITRAGKWVQPPKDAVLTIHDGALPEISPDWPLITADIHGFSVAGFSLDLDVIFPVLHGPYGEDGTVQGMLEMAGIKYVGSGVLASAVAMDKSFAKPIFESAGLKVVDGIVFNSREWFDGHQDRILAMAQRLTYPVFVKPARGGSSRGTSKVKMSAQLESAVAYALEFDTKVMIESGIVGREIECAVLQNHGVAHASPVGQIVVLGNHEFYDFEAKYLDDSTRLDFPDLDPGVEDAIRAAAVLAFDALGCEGLARVDFFLTDNGEIIINELNTLPGFTATSVYPKLWDQAGLNYSDLISKLIQAALWRSADVTR